MPIPPNPKISPFCLEGDDALQVHRARLHDHADDGEHERQLVRDELRGGAQRAEQRVLVRARPSRHQHADDRQARDRERVEHADVERRDDDARSGRDHDEHEERRHHDDRGRQREDTPVGLLRHDVFLLHELDAVADELVPAVEPARVHRAEPALHVAHHLQQERCNRGSSAVERHEAEHDHRLDARASCPTRCPNARRVTHRSMSPRMK